MADPNQLSVNRTFEIGFGTMSNKSSLSGKEFSLHVQKRMVKGSPGDFATLRGSNDQNLDTPNIHQAEFVHNEPGDTLVVEFEGYIVNNAFHPKTPEILAKEEIIRFMELYRDKGGLRYQAEAIFQNLLNFRWLRRNNQIYQRCRRMMFKTEDFECHFKLPNSIELPEIGEIEADQPDSINRCMDFCESRMHQTNVDRWFKVRVEILVGRGMNLFPAQEMNIDKKGDDSTDSKKNRHGRTFLKGVNEYTGRRDTPLIDERHILYALYTSDTSYAEGEGLMPINVNPSGFVEAEGTHYRDYKGGNCLYNYQEQLDQLIKELENVKSPESIPAHCHYLVTNYIKGGLFGEKSE